MAHRIEDYALVGDCHTGALISAAGSIDWLCLPRFDSDSLFGALLGSEEHGHWTLAPDGDILSCARSYSGNSFTLVTRWVTATGEVEVTDFMPYGNHRADLVRRVRGIRGVVTLQHTLRIRFGYATALPWVRQPEDSPDPLLLAVAGPDAVAVRGTRFVAHDHVHTAHVTAREGDVLDTTLTWHKSHRPAPPPIDVDAELENTQRWWNEWASAATIEGKYADAVQRSLLVLRALTHGATGGIVAAATTSLPESWGGVRNWDYRFVWLRDASATLEVLLSRGYTDGVEPWRKWLLRTIAGDPSDIQIMYGLAGERDLTEREVTSLPGYGGARPVRRGNAGFQQYQSDIFGELMVALHKARELGIEEDHFSWPLQRSLMSFVEENWQRPDHGIWEVRGPLRHFTHSRAMLWAACDRAVRAVEEFGLEGPVSRWRALRDTLADEIESHCFDPVLNSYTQYAGSGTVDASLLQLTHIGYLSARDPRMLGTVARIEAELLRDGLVLRYRTKEDVDGLPPGEHPFLACSFWLVEQYALSGRSNDAEALMTRLLGFSNDVGLLSEEYDVTAKRQMGNTPQALTHLALIRAAGAISASQGSADSSQLARVSRVRETDEQK